MRALFITTGTPDCHNHVSAYPYEYEHVTFKMDGIRNDWKLVEEAEKIRPEIIFYIGAARAPANPKKDALHSLRKIAPTVNMVSDAADTPWHPVLRYYEREGCFDLQAAIDGGPAPAIGVATLTPVNARAFAGKSDRDIRCGFSGNFGMDSERGYIIRALHEFGGLTIRSGSSEYRDHAAFMKRCRMTVNVSLTGSGLTHHIKGRVLEAGWAGCALLEPKASPISDWFPEGCWIPYEGPRHAASLIQTLTDREIDDAAHALSEAVRDRYTAEQIYGQMIEGAARTVPSP